ncbi:low-specificity L-threonine aldolase [Chitinimonas arctica]|uniref:Low-specificity L-threonine aldolase n=1 Tax=Chitinimonas arctica TaxID=2594795 RepID=A0A516SGD5_9NEIS|nr:low-specificity L-threonine aldolase [Chitinimonas arctica]QDQ27088.1 low-specificity L-threonine aldolase [Chitinimonas arctica]
MSYPQAATGPVLYDFRSDTVTRPGAAMRAAMAAAEVGDDVWGDDPTVLRLQAVAAEMLGYEAGLFVPSGTQSNLIGLLAHCQRGDEYLVGQDAHTYKYEGGGAAVLGSIQPQPIENAADGTIPLEKLKKALKPDDAHFARTRLLALENTTGGKVLPTDYVRAATDWAHGAGLATHLDGARLFNAAVARQVAPAEIARGFDSVSICLSKGLGAPVGSVLLGSHVLIAQGKRWRKMLGGGMRQAGILAAAGLYALDRHIDRLADDHANASRLADGLSRLPGLTVESQTNMVFVQVAAEHAADFAAYLATQGLLVSSVGSAQRWVTHLDVDTVAVDAALAIAARFFDGR